MNKKKKKLRILIDDDPSYVRLTALLTVVYFIVLIVLVQITAKFDIALYQADNSPSTWLKLLLVFYYAVPAGLAFIFALIFRPFWSNFRNLLLTIFLIHGLYSLTVYALRYHYLQQRENAIHRSKIANVKVRKARHKLFDRNQDGKIEKIEFLVTIDASALPNGRYVVYGTISQRGQVIHPGRIGQFPLSLRLGKKRIVKAKFHFETGRFVDHFGRGEFELNLGIERKLSVNKRGKKIRSFSRWAPFLRATDWRGTDPQIYNDIIDLEYLQRVDAVSLMPLQLKRAKVFVNEYLRDFARDLDGDGLYDELVVVIEFESVYEGAIFIQASLAEGDLKRPVVNTAFLKEGLNEIEYVLSGKDLHASGINGPYELVDVQLSNADPQCKENCPPRLRPDFTVYLDYYITDEYKLREFNK